MRASPILSMTLRLYASSRFLLLSSFFSLSGSPRRPAALHLQLQGRRGDEGGRLRQAGSKGLVLLCDFHLKLRKCSRSSASHHSAMVDFLKTVIANNTVTKEGVRDGSDVGRRR